MNPGVGVWSRRIRRHNLCMLSLQSPAPMAARRAPVLAALCAALVLALSACSAGGGSASQPSSPSSATEPTSGPAAAAAGKAMLLRFFGGTVPISNRLPLLQDSAQFASFVHSQAQTSIGGLILAASATVSKVTMQPPGNASVIFTVLLSGRPLEKNLHGAAVYVAGHWKVAKSSFCSLLRLAYGKKSHVIPAACGG